MFSETQSTVILITRQGMGDAEQPLPMKLIQTYLTLLNDSNTLPDVICFYTDGVKLVVDAASLESLRGASIDFVDDPVKGSGFVVNNVNLGHNSEEGCGSGSGGCGGSCSCNN